MKISPGSKLPNLRSISRTKSSKVDHLAWLTNKRGLNIFLSFKLVPISAIFWMVTGFCAENAPLKYFNYEIDISIQNKLIQISVIFFNFLTFFTTFNSNIILNLTQWEPVIPSENSLNSSQYSTTEKISGTILTEIQIIITKSQTFSLVQIWNDGDAIPTRYFMSNWLRNMLGEFCLASLLPLGH